MRATRRTALFAFLTAALAAVPRAEAQSIFTFAGGGSDDGRPATQAGLAFPSSVAFDAAGNLHVADRFNHRIRKVDLVTGVISTVAGTGASAFAGEGQPAALASLSRPTGIAFDDAGNLYVADTDNRRVRRVDAATKRISTVAGSGEWGSGGDGGPALAAQLMSPTHLSFGPDGDLYVSDYESHRVRRIALSAHPPTISTVLGNGTAASTGDGGPAAEASVNGPVGVALDPSGNLYVAEEAGNRVRRVERATGRVSTVVGTGTAGFGGDGGPASAAQLFGPDGLAFDPSGNLYVADWQNLRVRKVTPAGTITTFAGTGDWGYSGDGGPALSANVIPVGVGFDRSGNLHIAEWDNHRVRKVDASTLTISTVAGSGLLGYTGDGGPATKAGLRMPRRFVFDTQGNLYLADAESHRIRRITNASGLPIQTVVGIGLEGMTGDGGPAEAARLYYPSGVAFDAQGNLFLTAGADQGRVRRVDAATKVITTWAGGGDQTGDGIPATAARLQEPQGLVVDAGGDVYVAEMAGHRVRKVDSATRTITTVAGTGTAGTTGDGGPATAAALESPADVALDGTGGLLIAQYGRVRRVDLGAGTIASVAGGGESTGDGGPATAAALGAVAGLALDAQGNLYLSDRDLGLLRKVAAGTGTITTVAGNELTGFYGDGGRATEAGLTLPEGIRVDGRGNVYVADTAANRLRVVLACTSVTAPVLAGPAGGATGLTAPVLSWGAVTGAFRYDVRLDTANPPARVVASDLTGTSFSPANLVAGTTYHWSVEAKGDPFCTPVSRAASEVRSFALAAGCTAPAAFDAVSPAAGATGVATTPTLTWQSAPGASVYDVYLGTSSPPPLVAEGRTGTSFTAVSTGGVSLAPGTVYYWTVVAHAGCDKGKTTATPVRSFTVAGTCAVPAAPSLGTPVDGGTEPTTAPTLSWSASANAASYDLYFGTDANPPLYLTDLIGSSFAMSGLSAGTTYRWKVVARSGCDPTKDAASAVSSFTVSGSCPAPGAPTVAFAPASVGAGQTYVIAWDAAPGLDERGGYVVERSSSSSFSTVLDRQVSRVRHASFVASSAGTLYHRVRAVAGCGSFPSGPPSAAASVTVTAGTPNVVFSLTPRAVVTELGQRLESVSSRFALENVGATPVTVFLGRQELGSPPFFTVVDPQGGDTFGVVLQPRQPKAFEVRFSGPPNNRAGSYQGLVVVALQGAGTTATPYAFVNLKVGGGESAAPQFALGGTPTEYAFFPGAAGDDGSREPLEVDVRNPGATPMEVAAEIGPETWLVPEPGWNATPIPPGGSRTVRLYTKRSLAPNGSAYPRYTYLTVRTLEGAKARLLVQDNDRPAVAAGRGAPLAARVESYVVPSVVKGTSAIGNTFVSRLRLSNAGAEAVAAELLFSPADADGFDPASVRRATVLVPPNDVVALTDPLVQLFGLTPPVAGSLEVRAAPEKVGSLSVTSQVDAPSAATGGTFGFQMPTVRRGEGARFARPFSIPGITATSAYRTNLILVETTGLDQAQVRVTLYDKDGNPRGSKAVAVPRYGQKQISGVVAQLGFPGPLDRGRLEIEVERGGGAVVGVVTVIDNAVDDAVTYVSQPSAGRPGVLAFREALSGKASWAREPQATTLKYVVPAVVNGFKTFKDQPELPYTFQSLMGFTSLTATPATFTLTYRDLEQGEAETVRTVTVPARKTVEYANVLEELFGVPPLARSQGPVLVEASSNGLVYCKVYSITDTGTLGDSFPVVAVPSDSLTGGDSLAPIGLDGLEQSVDPNVGTRSNLILNEVLGQPAEVAVRLYEAGNRTVPIAEGTYSLRALEKLQLSTVFVALGLGDGDRLKDRTNVQVTVTALPGSAGLVSGVVTTIDNRTGDTKNSLLTPSGGIEATGGGTIGF